MYGGLGVLPCILGVVGSIVGYLIFRGEGRI